MDNDNVLNTACLALVLAALLLCAGVASGQGQTTSFTYQGRLTDANNPANGNYDLQFGLFDNASGPTQIGSTLTKNTVAVSGGVFTLQLDFGVSAFPGADRFLEISVRAAGVGAFTTLSPRQQISSTPYAIRTLSATQADGLSGACVNCVQDAQINSMAGSKVTGTIPVGSVPTGSGNYIQNTSSPQASANFNISGNGTAASMNVNGPVSVGGIAPPATAPAGQGRIYFDSSSNKVKVSENGGAFVNLVGAGGVSGSGTTNNIPLWTAGTTLGNSLLMQSGGNVGIGTTTPQSMLDVRGSLTLEAGSSPGLFTGTGNTELNRYLALLNSPTSPSASGLKAGGILVSDSYSYANPGKNDLIVKGNVGIGTTSPTSKLGVQTANNLYGFTHTNGTITVGSYIDSVGGWLGTKTNHPLFFFTNDSLQQMTLATNGNVGIGTSTPNGKLDARGGSGIGVYGESAAASFDIPGVYGRSTANGGTGVLGAADGSNARGVYGASGNTTGVGVFGQNPVGYAMYANGNAGQARDKGGWVKAMALVNDTGGIQRCYNGLTGATSGGCGFSVTHFTSGGYGVDFGFKVDDRFVSVTPQYATNNFNSVNSNAGANYSSGGNANTINVFTFDANQLTNTRDQGFMIFIF
jgi:hypothetical protein